MSNPGKAEIAVRDPRPLRPPARKQRNETQAMGGSDITFKCYGADVTATYSTPAVCNGSTVTATPTAAPTVAPKSTIGTYQSAASEKGGLHCSWRGCKWW